jgi:hypothetical protein
MKKFYIFTVLILISSQSLIGQNTNQLNELIIESLHSYINYSLELQKSVCKNCEKYDTYICQDGLPSNFPYNSVENIKIISVDYFRAYSNPLKTQLKKGITALFVCFELNNNQLEISVSSKGVKLIHRTTISVAVSDWAHYIYEYSCDRQKWELKESRYGGI